MQRRRVVVVLALASCQLAAAIGLTLSTGSALRPSAGLLVAIAAFAAVGCFPLPLELGRDRFIVTLSEVVLAVALATVSPVSVVLGATFGEAISVARYGVSPVKLLYNTFSRAFSTSLAVAVLAAIGADTSASTYVFGLVAAVIAAALADTVSTAAAISVSLGQRMVDIVERTTPPAMAVATASGSLGVLTIALLETQPALTALLAPMLLLVAATSRGAAAHRDERLRTQRLYEAVAATSTPLALSQLVGVIAQHAASLTGASHVVVAVTSEGRRDGCLLTNGDESPLPGPAADAAAAMTAGGPLVQPVELLPPAIRAITGGHTAVIVPVVGREAELTIVAVRSVVGPERPDSTRLPTLAAYASQAHLAVTRALLLENLQDALDRQIDLNRRKDEFVATVSHELRTPLTASIAAVELLQRHRDRLGPERAADLLDTAAVESRRLRDLIDDLLTMAAIDHGGRSLDVEPQPLDGVRDLILRAGTSVIPDRIAFTVDADAPGRVLADMRALDRVVMNLLGNAAKYAAGSEVHITASTHPAGLEITFADHGPGVPEHATELIFERFRQLDQSATRQHGGTGLGLHLSRQLAEGMGGELSFRPTIGGGATFALVLALPDDADHRMTPGAAPRADEGHPQELTAVH